MYSFKLNTEILGDSKQTIVFLPGMLATISFWINLALTLSKKYQTVSLDLLGFGNSPKPKINYTLTEHLDSINLTLNSLNINQPFILVGHSMGGLLALEFTKKYPQKVKKLILVSTPIFLSARQAQENISKHSSLHKSLLYGPSARLACFIFCKYLRPLTALGVIYFLKNLPRQVAKDTLLHTWYSYSGTRKNIVENQNPLKDIEKIKCPIRIIYGQYDKRINLSNLLKFQSQNKNIRIKQIKNVGHQLPLSKPEALINLINHEP